MSLSHKISALLSASAITLLTIVFGMTANASADCIFQYNPNGFNTSATPVFNSICGAPDGVGDEANFVRIRPDVNGNDEDNNNNPNYSIGTINSACNNGDEFDIWNYVHNNASQNDNPDVGNGSAVANNTYINMNAPVGTTSDKFSFNATVGASNATPASVTAMTPAVLDCNGNQVQLSLVSGSVHIYSLPYGSNWLNLPDNSLNTNLPIGSTNTGGEGTGTMWGCWNYRIVIVYQVKVTPVPPQQTPPTCNYLTPAANDSADIESVSYSANSANVTGVVLNLFGGTSTSGTPVASSDKVPFTFANLAAGQEYTIVATVDTNLGDVTSPKCQVTFTTPTTPSTPPATVVSTPPTPTTTLPATGPSDGGIAAIFAGVSALGSGAYYWLLRRRLANK